MQNYFVNLSYADMNNLTPLDVDVFVDIYVDVDVDFDDGFGDGR